MRVRPRTDDDIDACVGLLHLLHDSDGYPAHWPDDPRRFVAHPKQLGAWVIEEEGVPVAHIALNAAAHDQVAQPASEACGTPVEQLATVARLMVAPQVRRQGYGRILLAVATREAHARGLRPILDTAEANAASSALYDAMGWTRAGAFTIRFRTGETLASLIFIGPPPDLVDDLVRRAKPVLDAHGTATLVVDDFTTADVPLWSAHPSSARSLGRALGRRDAGKVEYLAVRAPTGEALAKCGIEYTQEPGAGVIYQLDVLEPFQGLGLGTRLIEEAERRIKARGFELAMMGVEDDNPRARELYERLGYGFLKREQESWEYLDEAGVNRTHSTSCAVLAKSL